MLYKGIIQANRINYCCGNMKSNAYVSIEAHVLQCRLHHNNKLAYSVALKSGKDQLVCTAFKQSTDLMIDMDTRLQLQADKHSFEQFPKLTLVVNVIGENKERKTVGSTFANYRKEGVQTFQISQCSCKDKAFEVDISFTTKILQPKSSNTKSNKNQSHPTPKSNYLSHQVSPRSSRELKTQLVPRPIKQPQKRGPGKEEKNGREIFSERALGEGKKRTISKERGEVQVLKVEIAELNQKVMQYEQKIQQLKRYKKMMLEQQINSEKWQQLLELQQQKNSIAMNHIVNLQQIILNIMPKSQSLEKMSFPSFRTIEEEDQLTLINEELQAELEKERKLTKILSQQIQYLRQELQTLNNQLNITKAINLPQLPQSQGKPSTIVESINEIMITSRCVDSVDTGKQQVLKLEIGKLEEREKQLKQNIETLEQTKKSLSKEIATKPRIETKKTQPNLTNKHQIYNNSPRKTEKPKSKEKIPKLPPMKLTKKNSPAQCSSSVTQTKKNSEVDKSKSSSNKKTEAVSQGESKTEGGESVAKCSDIGVNQLKSQHLNKVVNEVMYWGNTFEKQINDFQ